MLRWKKALLLICLVSGSLIGPTMAQTDSVRIATTDTLITSKPDLKLEQDKKRQKKTEKFVFVSCLFIVLTTILLYNVRSK